MPTRYIDLKDFSGGLNTAAAPSMLPANMTASICNNDILDSRSLKRRAGYTVVATFPDEVRDIYRAYFADGTKQWLCVTGTKLVSTTAVTQTSSGRVEGEHGYANGTGWTTLNGAGYSGGSIFVSASTATASFSVPACTQLTVRLLSDGSYKTALGVQVNDYSVTGSVRVDSGSWQNVTSPDAGTSVEFGSLTATAHTVYVKRTDTPASTIASQTWLGVDYIDWSKSVSSPTLDTTLTASTTPFSFATVNNKVYYGSAYDQTRSYNASTTATVSASGTAMGSFAVAHRRRLFVAAPYNDTAILTYSGLDTPEVFTSDTAGVIKVAGKDSGGECTGLGVWRDKVWYASPSRLYAITTSGDLTTWRSEEVSDAIGCIAPKSFATLPNGLAYLSKDGVAVYGMTSEFNFDSGFTIISRDIAPTIAGIANPEKAVGAYYNGRYWLACDADGTGKNDVVLVYRFPARGLPGAWTRFRYVDYAQMTGYNGKKFPLTRDDLSSIAGGSANIVYMGITAFHTTRGDESGLYAGTSSGKLACLDTSVTDGGNIILDWYETPPLSPGAFTGTTHFRPFVYIGTQADSTQDFTMTPTTDDVSGTAQTATVSSGNAIKTVRVPLSARGKALRLVISGNGAAQPRTLTSISVPYLPPRVK